MRLTPRSRRGAEGQGQGQGRVRGKGRGRSVVAGAGLVALIAVSGCTGSAEPPAGPTSPGGSTVPTGTADSFTATNPASSGPDSPLGFHWDMSKSEKWTPYLRTVPGTGTFFEFTWCEVEKQPGAQDWSKVDRAVRYAGSVGVTMTLKIRLGACWATQGEAQHTKGSSGTRTESRMPKDMAAYQGFVRSVVARYSPAGVHEYAVENEVNGTGYWAGSSADYTTLVRAAATAIHGADGAARVVDSGLSSTTYGYGIASALLDQHQVPEAIAAWNTYYERRMGTRGATFQPATDEASLRAMLADDQGQRNLDFLGAVDRLAADHIIDIRQFHFYERAAAAGLLMGYLRAHTPTDVPLEGWEVGLFWRDGAQEAASQAQSDEMVQTVVTLLAQGARRVFWLPLATNPDNKAGGEVRSGVLEPDGSERIASVAFRTLAVAARGATIAPITAAGLSGVALRTAGATTLILWATSGTRSLALAADTTGGPVGAAPGPLTTLSVGAAPVVVRSSTQTADAILSTLR